jgi:hypothetical protein
MSRYVLTMYMNPSKWETLTDDERKGVYAGHEDFHRITSESGEFVETKAFAEPDKTVVVRVRDGVAKSTDGAYHPADDFACGYYLVDVASQERAIELAELIPDAQYTAVEVRAVIHEASE